VGPFLAGIQVIGGPIPVVLYAVAGLAAIGLVLKRRRLWPATVVAALLIGASLGLLTCWIVGDLMNAFDVTLSPISRTWVALAFAGIALALVNLRRSRPRRKVGAVASIVVFALLGAVGVNADFGQYPTLASILGVSSFPDLPASVLATQRSQAGTSPLAEQELWKTWTPPANLPTKGLVGAVIIPATVSHFAARQALVYLPPAALVPHPPALPVLVMFSGQPGSPEHVFIAGHLDAVINQIAEANKGLAPIVIVPDQLSAPEKNPMCVDGALGNSATYLTVDVPNWIKANLDVQSATAAWGIGGFSQGGTCAIQLGAGHPELFGSIMDVSGELEPKVGSPAVTIQKGFAGNAAAYDAAKPLSIVAAHAPFANVVGVFAAGQLDTKYTPWIAEVAGAAKAAGIRTTVLSSPGTAHDWRTARYVFEHGLPTIFAQMGLVKP
jgi:enterochelin esterase-like enzyme